MPISPPVNAGTADVSADPNVAPTRMPRMSRCGTTSSYRTSTRLRDWWSRVGDLERRRVVRAAVRERGIGVGAEGEGAGVTDAPGPPPQADGEPNSPRG